MVFRHVWSGHLVMERGHTIYSSHSLQARTWLEHT